MCPFSKWRLLTKARVCSFWKRFPRLRYRYTIVPHLRYHLNVYNFHYAHAYLRIGPTDTYIKCMKDHLFVHSYRIKIWPCHSSKCKLYTNAKSKRFSVCFYLRFGHLYIQNAFTQVDKFKMNPLFLIQTISST